MTNTPLEGLTIRTLGTGGGPIVSQSRAGTSTAITVDGATYVIDCGMGSIRNYRRDCSWERLRAIFLTHHHSDHIYDLGSFLVTGWQVPGESFARPIEVYGPAAPSEPPAESAASVTAARHTLRGRTFVGTHDIVTALLDRVFASDIAVRMLDEGRSDPHEWVTAHDITVPETSGAHPVHNRHPEMAPFEIFRDEHVTVTAILVDHRLCYPAFAYRFDTRHGSVVISGDTAPSRNLVTLARDADVLLHEVIDLDAILATLPPGPTRAGIETHLRESHTPHTEVGKVAAAAGVGRLILHHICPNTPGSVDEQKLVDAASADFDGSVVIAADNDAFALVGARAATAEVTA